MDTQYVILKSNGLMLAGVGIGTHKNPTTFGQTTWTKHEECAIYFEEKEEAEATIEFITNVIDWEMGEEMYIEEV